MCMTDYFVKQHPELENVVEKHDLKFDLDDWGMGKVVFYKDREIGYWWQGNDGISMNYTVEFGLHQDFHRNYTSLGDGIDNRIREFEKQIEGN